MFSTHGPNMWCGALSVSSPSNLWCDPLRVSSPCNLCCDYHLLVSVRKLKLECACVTPLWLKRIQINLVWLPIAPPSRPSNAGRGGAVAKPVAQSNLEGAVAAQPTRFPRPPPHSECFYVQNICPGAGWVHACAPGHRKQVCANLQSTFVFR